MSDLRKQLVLELGGDPDNDHLVSDEHIISSVRRAVEADSTRGAMQGLLNELCEERDDLLKYAKALRTHFEENNDAYWDGTLEDLDNTIPPPACLEETND